MNAADGQRLVETNRRNDVKWTPCTRWAELRECVNYHAQLAALLEAPTQFKVRTIPTYTCVCVCVCVVVVVVVYTVQQPCFFLCVHVLCMNSHLVAVVVVAVVVVVVGVYARASVLEY